ncbi:FGGY-family carbohydrate kinase [Aurantimonas sp. 22II-16-19i]|uniref:FGGY-family carbohydrate kinase n=1 Tax=Aurantimonas sp. 22II-16-19i TaxID=1317114 RepID=UPI0009F7F1CF|nr:FGGY-family carbohydrate kinase [Aurantimonas sp. 22II-16-19i]ORE92053.1 carbohydrate kinase, FGGY family,carbohydrate kinase FGGY family protein [Aurantimonas sp. 22II-16-19i]
MAEPVVVGLDSSTQSTKAIAFDGAGRIVAEGRAPIALANPRFGWFEQEPADWRVSARAALAQLTAAIDPARIVGLAVSNQRETMAHLAADGSSVRPATVWLDERATAEVEALAARLGRRTIHEITGRPVDIIPCLYRLAWMQAHEPELYARTALFADVQSVLVMDLCGGKARTSWSSADPFALFDIRAKAWSKTILEAIDLAEEKLPETHAPGTRLGEITAEAAAATGLPKGCPVFAGGGDGQCAGLGTNCTDPAQAYVNLGTAVVSGVWQPDFAVSDAFRTEIAAQGDGYIFENCLRGGAFLINWFVDKFLGGRADPAIFDRLEAEASALPIGSAGVLVQPWWGGVMDPHWDSQTRGTILGLSGSHGPAHIYRAILEGITLWLAAATARTEAVTGRSVERYVAIGGGANSPLWRQMLADASGRPLCISGTLEASALGAGMIAATGAGWFPSIEAAAAAMSGPTRQIDPDPARGDAYGELGDIFAAAHAATADLNHRLVALANRVSKEAS